MSLQSISVAAILDDLKRRLPRALDPLGGDAMTTKEAFKIVLALAFDNMVDEDEEPEIHKQQIRSARDRHGNSPILRLQALMTRPHRARALCHNGVT